MSLYGLDIIITKDGRRHLNEINGINSGMRGFQEVYGDNRVEERVFDMLQNEYGTLTINDGTYARNQFRKEHPFRFARDYVLSITPLSDMFSIFSLFSPSFLFTEKAEVSWLYDEVPNPHFSRLQKVLFDSYNGQESTVINELNQELPHPTVNPFVAEAISRNKFLQYLLLDNSEIAETIITSSLVGLGAANEDELEAMISNHDHFVVKPILGCCGKGVRFLTKDEVNETYKDSKGPFNYPSPIEYFLERYGISLRRKYIEDLIEQGDFSFEPAVSIIQPFIDSRQVDDGREIYSVIRAIVCNGKFVDAYQRISSHPRVNLSQDAAAASFNCEGDFADFCEKVVDIFESRSGEYSPDSYQRTLYQRYIDKRGRTSDVQKQLDLITEMSPSMERIINIIDRNLGI